MKYEIVGKLNMILNINLSKKVRNILKKIVNGKASERDLSSLVELLDEEPCIVPEVTEVLNSILKNSNIKARNSAISALNKMSKYYLGLADYSVDFIVGCMQKSKKDFHSDSMVKILEILLKITERYPERMEIAVPELLMCLQNISATIREKAYFILALLAITHHEFFVGHSKEIVRHLNGLNLDERIYACKLIRIIAEKDHKIIENTYDILDDLRLNHPFNNLRREAAYTIERLEELSKHSKVDRSPVKTIQEPSIGSIIGTETEFSSESFSELSELISPDKEELKNMLEGMGLKHLIVIEGFAKNWENACMIMQ